MLDSTSEQLRSLREMASDPANIGKLDELRLLGDYTFLNESFPSLRVLGMGIESIVIDDPADINKVISLPWGENGIPKGIMPFSETYNIHKILSIILPVTFPRIQKIIGSASRETVRQKVRGDIGEDINRDDYWRYSHEIEAELTSYGIDLWIDPYQKNYIKSGDKRYYVDLVFSSVFDPYKLRLERVRQRIIETYGPDEVEKKYREVLISIRRLAELKEAEKIMNSLGESVSERTSKIDSVAEQINFQFDDGEGHDLRDERSRRRIALMLEKAVEIDKKGHFSYVNGEWVRHRFAHLW